MPTLKDARRKKKRRTPKGEKERKEKEDGREGEREGEIKRGLNQKCVQLMNLFPPS